jgi:hypothetical protein
VQLLVDRTADVAARRAGRGRDRAQRATWDEGAYVTCELLGEYFALEPREARTYAAHRWSSTDILGDSLPSGRYFLTAYTELNGELLLAPAGSVVLRRSDARSDATRIPAGPPTVHGPVLALDSTSFPAAVPRALVRSGPPASERGNIWVGAGPTSTLLVRVGNGVHRWTDWRAVGLRPGAVVSAWSTIIRDSDPPQTGANVLLVERTPPR